MRIVVLGAGVIGVATAWYLVERGHQVTIVDRQAGPARETSFANAGEVSPGYASPWAGPGIPAKALSWLFMKHAPLIIRPTADPAMYRWLIAMLGNCTTSAYARNKDRMVRLAEFSRDCLIELRAHTGIAYDERAQGTLQLFRTQKQLGGIGKDLAVLHDYGVPFEVLDAAGCVAAEPGLAHAAECPAGGLRLPNDETGDCFKFTKALFDHTLAEGMTARMGESVRGLVVKGGRITAVETDRGQIAADAFVVALGSYSPLLVAPLGLRLPVYPVKGYSITVPIADEARAPVSTILDESFKVATTRLGDRIRVAGMAEISGYSNDLPEGRKETLLHSLCSLFPGGGDIAEAALWSGLRPMTPDGTPVVGATSVPGLYLNTGHGTLGWTMACGSARVIADVIEGKTPPIAHEDLGISRYKG